MNISLAAWPTFDQLFVISKILGCDAPTPHIKHVAAPLISLTMKISAIVVVKPQEEAGSVVFHRACVWGLDFHKGQ